MADEKKAKRVDVVMHRKPIPKPAPKVLKYDSKTKMEKVKASKLPDWQKEQYLRRLEGAKAQPGEMIRFGAYCNMKGYNKKMRVALQAFPTAKGVLSATVGQWNEIFKTF